MYPAIVDYDDGVSVSPQHESGETTDDGRPSVSDIGKIGDLAAEAGLRRIHVLAWRDLADVEAGGSELHAATIASLWAEAGIDVTMRTSYAQGSPPESTRDGYRVIRRAGRYLVFPRAVGSELIGRHGRRDGLVEIWNGVPFFSPLWARGPKVTWLHHVHEEMWPMVLPPNLARAGQILERRVAPVFYRSNKVITLSESSRSTIVERMGLPPSNVSVVPPGIDPVFTAGGSKSDIPRVVAVGRLMPSKFFDVLIGALVRVRERVPARLTIIGDGYERDRLERQVAELGAESWCELPGRVSEAQLVEHYRRAWIVASASRSEGWGMTLTEAAACGTPAVATRIPGHTDAVDDGVTGLLASTDLELSDAVERLLFDPDLRDRMGAAAKARAEAFGWHRAAHDSLSVLAAEAQRSR